MLKRLTTLTFLLTLCAATLPQLAAAQMDIGARLGYDLEVEEIFLGIDGRYGLAAFPVVLNPSLDYFFVEDFQSGSVEISQTLIVIDLNALYEFGVDNAAYTPYAGLGLGLAYSKVDANINAPGIDDSDSNLDAGLNIVGGAVFGSGNLRPFVQARIRLGDADLLSIMGGLLIRIGE